MSTIQERESMREILFRGKNEKTGQWAYGVPLRCSRKTYIVKYVVWNYDTDGNEHLTAVGEIQVDPYTVGQFTGLLDKNGNQIFEGDILNGLYGDMLVCFGEIIGYGMGFMWKPVIEDGKWESITGFVDEYEVIGNKWDNPELLNP